MKDERKTKKELISELAELRKRVAELEALEAERRQARETLLRRENGHRRLLENLPQKIFYKDKNLIYVSCNENFARDLGIKPEDITGKTDYDLFPEELAEKYRADDKRIMESGKTENIEQRHIQDGQEVVVHAVKMPVKDEKDQTVGVLAILFGMITAPPKKADHIQ
jgi:PAS domain S-box-containing protein